MTDLYTYSSWKKIQFAGKVVTVHAAPAVRAYAYIQSQLFFINVLPNKLCTPGNASRFSETPVPPPPPRVLLTSTTDRFVDSRSDTGTFRNSNAPGQVPALARAAPTPRDPLRTTASTPPDRHRHTSRRGFLPGNGRDSDSVQPPRRPREYTATRPSRSSAAVGLSRVRVSGIRISDKRTETTPIGHSENPRSGRRRRRPCPLYVSRESNRNNDPENQPRGFGRPGSGCCWPCRRLARGQTSPTAANLPFALRFGVVVANSGPSESHRTSRRRVSSVRDRAGTLASWRRPGWKEHGISDGFITVY